MVLAFGCPGFVNDCGVRRDCRGFPRTVLCRIKLTERLSQSRAAKALRKAACKTADPLDRAANAAGLERTRARRPTAGPSTALPRMQVSRPRSAGLFPRQTRVARRPSTRGGTRAPPYPRERGVTAQSSSCPRQHRSRSLVAAGTDADLDRLQSVPHRLAERACGRAESRLASSFRTGSRRVSD